jgi:DNA-binding LytR/AlgR family response regulator
VAEDEPVLRAQLIALLGEVWPELEILGAAEDGVQAIRALEARLPDVLFLDVLMPGPTGLEVARYASGRCHVVFVTAYDQFAVGAFEEGAADYVMKPLTAGRLAIACARVRKRLNAAPANLEHLLESLASARARPHLRWINASRGAEVQLVTVDEICYFQSDTKYTRAVTATDEYLIRKSLKELLDELDPVLFWQIHRSTIVNVNAIASLSQDLRGRLLVKLKARVDTLAVSQPYAHLFRQM